MHCFYKCGFDAIKNENLLSVWHFCYNIKWFLYKLFDLLLPGIYRVSSNYMLTTGIYYRNEFKAHKDLVIYLNKNSLLCSSLSDLMWFEWLSDLMWFEWFSGEIAENFWWRDCRTIAKRIIAMILMNAERFQISNLMEKLHKNSRPRKSV